MSNQKNEPSDAQIISRLRRSRGGKTAAQLGTTSARLRKLDGVVEVGKVLTGKAGRPAILFDAQENAAEASARSDEPTSDPTAASRDGSL